MSGGPLHLLVGPPDHGVVRFGRHLAAAMGADVVQAVDPAAVPLPTGSALSSGVHLHYTDALYGRRTDLAATAFVELCGRLRRDREGPLTVTLHDVPDPDDTPDRWCRRAAAYRRVVGCVDTTVVCSEHERSRLESAFGIAGTVCPAAVAVIPLPVADRPSPVPAIDRLRPEVAVFGFVYPGKGHEEMLRAMADLPRGVDIAVLGRAADGHEHLLTRLTALAAAQGRHCRIDGFVPDARLTQRLRSAAVPVVPGRSVSASGSLNSWIEAGRRPLVAAGPYATEQARRFPAGLQLYRPDELPDLIRAALTDPARTWRQEPVPERLSPSAVAAAYARTLAAARTRQPV